MEPNFEIDLNELRKFLPTRAKDSSRTFDSLSLRQRQVVALRVAGTCEKDAASALGLSVGTIEVYFSRARELLGLQGETAGGLAREFYRFLYLARLRQVAIDLGKVVARHDHAIPDHAIPAPALDELRLVLGSVVSEMFAVELSQDMALGAASRRFKETK